MQLSKMYGEGRIKNTGKYWNKREYWNGFKTPERHSQQAFTCSKLTIETLEQGEKYVQS